MPKLILSVAYRGILDYSKLSNLSIRVGPMRIIEADYLVSVY